MGQPDLETRAKLSQFEQDVLNRDYDRAAERLGEDEIMVALSDMISNDLAYEAIGAAMHLGHEDLAEGAARTILHPNNGYSDFQKQGAEDFLKRVGKYEAAEMSSEQVSEMLVNKNYEEVRNTVTAERIDDALTEMWMGDNAYAAFESASALGLPVAEEYARAILKSGKFANSGREHAKAYLDGLEK